MSKIKGRLWGFRKKEVDDHINRLIKAQEMELEDLAKTIERFQRDNEILRHEISTLTETNISLPQVILLELALKRVERVAEYINQDVGMEVLAIEKITDQNSLLLENTMTEIDKDIEFKKEIIEKELKNIVEIARGKEKTKNINIEVLKSIAQVLPIAEWLKNNRDEPTNLGSHFWEEEPTDRAQELVEEMTSDGTTLESTQKPEQTKAFSADLNSMRNEIINDVDIPDNVIIPGYQEDEETNDNGYSVPEPQSKGIPNEQFQTGVREDISAVHDKNIVGRVAGEDITDSSGQIIIRKNEPITLNIMQRAKNGGKLAELIIQMALPQQEE